MSFTVAGRPTTDVQTGVWATTSIEPGQGSILAVDACAQESTQWPDANKAFGIDKTGDHVDAARGWVKA